jgi:energy-coupling factor transporter ATP-binding protein EcfA2
MRLKSIRVQNFRCFENQEFNLRDFTSLIGPNNAGKSTLLRAIAIFLSQEKPTADEWRHGGENEPIEIEGCFEEIEDWERNVPGIAGIIYNGEIKLKLIATKEERPEHEPSISITFEAFTCEEVITGWDNSWGVLSEPIKQVAEALGLRGADWRTGANKERVKQVIRQNHRDWITYGAERWSSDGISITPALKQALPQVVLIPAVSDANEHAKPAYKTTFGILMSKVLFPAIQQSDEYKKFKDAVDALGSKIRGGEGIEKLKSVQELEADITIRMKSIIESRAVVALAPPDIEKFIGNSATIRLDDGVETPIHLQGHGVQRAFIFALIEVLAKQTAKIDSQPDAPRQRATILLFEEPELYVHPHLMRRLKKSLQQLSESSAWQVVISTHSPFLVDVAEDPLSLVILRKESPNGSSIPTQLQTDPFGQDQESQRDKEALRAALDFHPTVTEAFFARRVVLVEGDTEVAILRQETNVLALSGIAKDKIDTTTVVSCGGKWTIPAIAKLLDYFNIPFRIIHDLDRKGRSDEELMKARAIDPFRANARIEAIAGRNRIWVVEDTFENILSETDQIPSNAKPYHAWRKVRELCDGKTDLDHAPRLKEVVEWAFNW